MHPRFAIGMGEVANSKGEGEGANLLFDQSPPKKTVGKWKKLDRDRVPGVPLDPPVVVCVLAGYTLLVTEQANAQLLELGALDW